ncbi:transglycosylase domain-containing protein [Dactylosporangium fulvum]|uniref:Penicillin-binding protein n=1 Tax=Dactylosporangium fulvum TaxID=53359 RepID=A0ABY5W012_9ACTN|nr:transglycosylase domain-containing protein [Dactylosporangium fulvum]UWP82730.1 penicillin-binding protein [Dactylosporangium fulvum]
MNYGDPDNPPSGRAQVPGSTPGPDDSIKRAEPPPTGSAGRATVGRAQVGRASVSPPSSPVSGEPATARASVTPRAAASGSARASASVPVAGAAGSSGRAAVARASVRVGAPAEGIADPPGDIISNGPGGKGKGAASTSAKAKKRRRRNILIASIAAFIMIAGIGMVSGTYYFDQVALPEDLTMKQSTTIYYADGVTPMARIGDENRTVVSIDDIPKHVQQAVVAAEDNTFYTNDGVDYKGVVRAAWNNVTGGERQGASTISQQYARRWAELEDVTYARKLREAVIALKLNRQYDKDKIMEMYLNVVYFGRNSYGIQAAAQAYFGKPAKELTIAEGMVLAGIIKNPEGGKGGSPFDPNIDKQQALNRFNYIKGQMVKLNFVPAAEADTKMAYPEGKVLTPAQARENAKKTLGSMDKPEGLIVHHVLEEVAALTNPTTGKLLYEDTDSDGKKNFDRIRNGGLKIVTTVDHVVQQIAVREASRNKESNMNDQPKNLQAALVAVEPGTGAVKAYYGGDKGTGADYAGCYNDPVLGDGGDGCFGAHPPGSTFKVYTLATGLIDGYKIDSYWNGDSPQEFPNSGRTSKNPVKNAGEGTTSSPDCKSHSGKWCTLEEVTVKSLNVPFFALAELVGPAKVIDTARAAGITEMWATVKDPQTDKYKSSKIDLVQKKGSEVFPTYFNTEVAFGQYPVTVLEHAGGIATFGARGLAAKTHFLKEVWTEGKKTYGEVIKPTRIPGFTDQMADDLNTVLQGVPKHYNLKLKDGRQLAGKTGTWQLGQTTSNAHAWMVGYSAYDPNKKSPGLAAAVWVGNKAEEQKIVNKNGSPIIGGNLPGPIWRDFLDGALTAMKMPVVKFPAPKYVGHKDVGTGVSPAPSIPLPGTSGDPNIPGGGNGGLPGNPGSPSPGQGGNGGGNGGGIIPTTSPTRRR